MSVKGDWRGRAGTMFTTEKQAAVGSRGVVTANHPLGAAAGAEMLAAGGNAIDAAVATLFALNVVEPMMVGVFGAGWMNVRLADGRQIVIDNYSTAPAAAQPTLYTPVADGWPNYMETVGDQSKLGYLACGVPGNLKAWAELVEQYGRFSLADVMGPAIRYAANGFRATPYLNDCIGVSAAEVARFPETARTFLPDGRPVKAGELVRQPELAESLQAIAAAGPGVLYGGALGQLIVDDIQKNGGIMTAADLEAYEIIYREPLRGHYRGYEIVVPAPPCSGGLHILQILQILEGYDVAALGFGTPEMIHLLAECFKIAFTDRAAHVGDQQEVPVEWLISAAYGAERRAGIDMGMAHRPVPGVPPSTESGNTTHVTAADADGNIACLTQTINHIFGSKVTVPGTGIILNNTMALFDPHPGMANSVASGKRMVSSMSPTILLKDGQPFMALGTPGGVRIFPAVLQAIINVIDHGMSLQEAVEAPRVWTQGQELELEEGVAAAVRPDLAQRGHRLLEVSAVAGGMN
ncbi:MAG: gamma-glutamyltransferase, partial [Anaerolineales bacterium]|nr:gamma-glutamyltransferase [Anaerolineales bacterium]